MSDNKDNKDKTDLKEIGALWRRKGSKGDFYSGKITLSDGKTVEILCFKNSFKEAGDKKPDLRIYESAPR